jgi:ribose transport system ATP-binding protein
VPQLTVADNLFLGREIKGGLFLDKKKMGKDAQSYFEMLGMTIDFDLGDSVEELDTSRRQIVEIVKALMQHAKVLILDEPSNSLTDEELKNLFSLIQHLKRKKIGIIYISHRMEEIRAVADRVTVLRDGRNVSTLTSEEATDETLINLVTGKKKGLEFPVLNKEFGDTVLELREISTREGLEKISFKIREGEILGIGGLMGSGKEDIGRSLFGLEKVISGEVIVHGHQITELTPANLLQNGIVYFPSNKHDLLIACRNLLENQTILSLKQFIGKWVIDKKTERNAARDSGHQLNINPLDLNKIVSYFSGGNQKKILISRAMLKEGIKIFVLDEVTHGIDVGSKMEIFNLVSKLAEKGAAVIYISSELEELIHLCHRILAMHHHHIVKEVPSDKATRELLLQSYFGVA